MTPNWSAIMAGVAVWEKRPHIVQETSQGGPIVEGHEPKGQGPDSRGTGLAHGPIGDDSKCWEGISDSTIPLSASSSRLRHSKSQIRMIPSLVCSKSLSHRAPNNTGERLLSVQGLSSTAPPGIAIARPPLLDQFECHLRTIRGDRLGNGRWYNNSGFSTSGLRSRCSLESMSEKVVLGSRKLRESEVSDPALCDSR